MSTPTLDRRPPAPGGSAYPEWLTDVRPDPRALFIPPAAWHTQLTTDPCTRTDRADDLEHAVAVLRTRMGRDHYRATSTFAPRPTPRQVRRIARDVVDITRDPWTADAMHTLVFYLRRYKLLNDTISDAVDTFLDIAFSGIYGHSAMTEAAKQAARAAAVEAIVSAERAAREVTKATAQAGAAANTATGLFREWRAGEETLQNARDRLDKAARDVAAKGISAARRRYLGDVLRAARKAAAEARKDAKQKEERYQRALAKAEKTRNNVNATRRQRDLAEQNLERARQAAGRADRDDTPNMRRWPTRAQWRKIYRQKVIPGAVGIWDDAYAQITDAATKNASENARNAQGIYSREVGDRLDDFYDYALKRVNNFIKGIEKPEKLRERLDALRTADGWQGAVEGMSRTEATQALNSGSLAAAIDQQDQMGVPWVKTWISVLDDRVRATHRHTHGQSKPLNEPFLVGGFRLQFPGDPRGPAGEVINCFPGDTEVVIPSALRKVYRRWYEGPMVKIRTRSGKELSGTPNHPLLTDTGWQPIHRLKVGDKLLGTDGTRRMGVGDPQVQHVPTSIGEVYRAACEASPASRVRGSDMDFHGDGADGQVEVVATHRDLSSYLESVGRQVDEGPVLSEPYGRQGALAGVGAGDGGFELDRAGGRLLTAAAQRGVDAAGDIGGVGVGSALVERHAGHTKEVCLASPTNVNPGSDKASPDDAPISAERLAERLLALPGDVPLDEVVHVEIRAYAGHVYNLETDGGWYIASCLVAHNCRCILRYEPAPTKADTTDTDIRDEELPPVPLSDILKRIGGNTGTRIVNEFDKRIKLKGVLPNDIEMVELLKKISKPVGRSVTNALINPSPRAPETFRDLAEEVRPEVEEILLDYLDGKKDKFKKLFRTIPNAVRNTARATARDVQDEAQRWVLDRGKRQINKADLPPVAKRLVDKAADSVDRRLKQQFEIDELVPDRDAVAAALRDLEKPLNTFLDDQLVAAIGDRDVSAKERAESLKNLSDAIAPSLTRAMDKVMTGRREALDKQLDRLPAVAPAVAADLVLMVRQEAEKAMLDRIRERIRRALKSRRGRTASAALASSFPQSAGPHPTASHPIGLTASYTTSKTAIKPTSKQVIFTISPPTLSRTAVTSTFATEAAMTTPTLAPVEVDAPTTPAPHAGEEGEPGGLKVGSDGSWEGVLGLMDQWSSDMRMLAAPEGPVRARPLPLPLLVQGELAPGHDKGKLGVGRIDEIWSDGNFIMGRGKFDIADPFGAELARKVGEGFVRFVSLDVDDATEEAVCTDDNGNVIDCDPTGESYSDRMGRRFTGWRVMGATLLAHPAFPDAFIALSNSNGKPADTIADSVLASLATTDVAHVSVFSPALATDPSAEVPPGTPADIADALDGKGVPDRGNGCVKHDGTSWSPCACTDHDALPADAQQAEPDTDVVDAADNAAQSLGCDCENDDHDHDKPEQRPTLRPIRPDDEGDYTTIDGEQFRVWVTATFAVDAATPWADRDTAWDGDAARKAVADWAADNDGNIDAKKMGQAFLVVDGNPRNATSYKFGVATVTPQGLRLVWNAVKAAYAALQGARTPTTISADLKKSAISQVNALYKAAAKAFDDPSILDTDGAAMATNGATPGTDAKFDDENKGNGCVCAYEDEDGQVIWRPCSCDDDNAVAADRDGQPCTDLEDDYATRTTGDTGCTTCQPAAITAAATAAHPAEAPGWEPLGHWFDNPGLSEPTPITVDPDTGRVYGHAATWGTCHVGYADRCITPPRSATDYSYFHTSPLRTSTGTVYCGLITMDTGHAELHQAHAATVAHYDNTGTQAAVVCVGEDQYGIWVAGSTLPGLSADERLRLSLARFSGDWRTIRGGAELVAILAVNNPGFPIPARRTGTDNRDYALVAAGMLPPRQPEADEPTQTAEVDLAERTAALVLAALDRRESNKRRRAALANPFQALKASADRERKARAAAAMTALGNLTASTHREEAVPPLS